MILSDSIAARVGSSVVRATASATNLIRSFRVFTEFAITSAISDAIYLVKSGAGILTLSGNNTYTGTTTIREGIVSIESPNSLPGFSKDGRFSVASGAALTIGNAVPESQLTQIRDTSNFASGSFSGFDTTAGDRTLSSAITGTIGLIKIGLNTLTLSTANTYTGKTLVKKGTLATNAANQISDSSAAEVEAGATFQFGGNDSVDSIAGAGTVALGANNLTLVGTGTTVFSGTLTNTTGRLTKSGTGSQTISGTSSMSQDLTHSGGTLIFAGNFTTSKDLELCRGTSAAPANCLITGTLTQTGYGLQGPPRSCQIAQNANNVGTLTITGATVSLYGGLFIGDNRSTGSNGTLVLNSGQLVTNGAVWLAGPTATIICNGGTTHTITQMYVSGGGHATDNPNPVSVVTMNGGIVDITGPWSGSAYIPNQSLILFGVASAGISSTSTLNLNGGSIKLNQLSANTPASGTTQINTINFNGGTLDYDKGFNGRSLPNAVPAGVTWNFIVKSGGASISVFSGATLYMAVAFSNDGGNGGLTKIGPGTLDLGSLAHAYNGATSISAGAMSVAKTNGSSTATATFTSSSLSVSFNTAPTAGMTFRFFPGSTAQTYGSVALTGAPGRTGSYNSANSTLTIS